MKHTPLLSFLLFVFQAVHAVAELPPPPPSEKLFVCGHSFMIYTAKMLPPMAQAAQFPFQLAGEQMIGGSKVIQHWDLADDKNKAKAALREGNVDVLTLSPHRLLPDPGIENFVKLGLEKNPNLRVLVQASWPPYDNTNKDGFKNAERNDVTVENLLQMREAHRVAWVDGLEDQVRKLNASVGREAVFIVPASDAVFDLRERVAGGTVPGIAQQSDLFRDPIGHPEPALAMLVTYCHFATIYQRSPVGLPVPAEYKTFPHAEELNKVLQEIAWNAVTRYPMSGVKAIQFGASKDTTGTSSLASSELKKRPRA